MNNYVISFTRKERDSFKGNERLSAQAASSLEEALEKAGAAVIGGNFRSGYRVEFSGSPEELYKKTGYEARTIHIQPEKDLNLLDSLRNR